MANENIRKTGPKDVFLHLLSIATLYFSAISLGALLFQFINIAYPDVLTNAYYQTEGYYNIIRWSVAVLIIVFPVYVWSLWYLEKEARVWPEKRELATRRWLLYFTVFAAAGVIIGDLVSLIFNYLQGELTARFFLKIAAVLLIAASVFAYYLWNLRRSDQEAAGARVKIFSWAVIVMVLGLVIAGFYTAGSPQAARDRNLDQQRVNQLQGMQSQIVYFWQQKNRLPADAAELTDSISGYSAPKDPETGQPYEYKVRGNLEFQLCAVFKTDGLTQGRPVSNFPLVGGVDSNFDNWQHGAGRACFDRTIDPQLYQIKK